MNPSPEESGANGSPQTDATDTILVVIEGPGDTTRRPRPPSIPLDFPRDKIVPPDEVKKLKHPKE